MTTAAPTTSPMTRRLLQGVMGGRGEIRVVGGDDPTWLLDVATSRLADLEERWTRFAPTSDIRRVTASAGRWVDVAPETVEILDLAGDAWRLTGGRFDPTVAAAVAAAGYDRTFAEVVHAPPPALVPPTPPIPGIGGVEIDRAASRVRVAAGVALDLGGIGKGRAADLVADELCRFGAAGACVNLGGDVALRGTGPDGGAWTVAIADPWAPDDPRADLGSFRLLRGGVATSTTLLRRWTDVGGRAVHHLIDPATGRPSASPLVAVTVVAADAAWAEVLAKAALLAGPGEGSALLVSSGVAGLLVAGDRTVDVAGDLDAFLAGPLTPPTPEVLL